MRARGARHSRSLHRNLDCTISHAAFVNLSAAMRCNPTRRKKSGDGEPAGTFCVGHGVAAIEKSRVTFAQRMKNESSERR
jgi:hypothetical protein